MKDAYYFPHFSNAKSDRKIKRLRKDLGIEGYGIYFMLLETLRDQEGFRFPMEDVDLLADEFGTSEAKVKTVICNYDLFQVDENQNFFSLNFIKYLTPYIESKRKRKIAGIKGNLIKYGYATKEQLSGLSDLDIIELNDNKEMLVPMLSHSESHSETLPNRSTSQKKEKERKEKERKEKERKEKISDEEKIKFMKDYLGKTEQEQIKRNFIQERQSSKKGLAGLSNYINSILIEGYDELIKNQVI